MCIMSLMRLKKHLRMMATMIKRRFAKGQKVYVISAILGAKDSGVIVGNDGESWFNGQPMYKVRGDEGTFSVPQNRIRKRKAKVKSKPKSKPKPKRLDSTPRVLTYKYNLGDKVAFHNSVSKKRRTGTIVARFERNGVNRYKIDDGTDNGYDGINEKYIERRMK